MLHRDQVLLIQRGQAPSKGKWTLPGGVIEVGESPEEALVREIKEECQVKICVQEIVEVVNRVLYDDQRKVLYHYVILDYLAYCQSDDDCQAKSVQAGSDVMNARWVSVHELEDYDTTDGVIDVIHKAIAFRDKR
ncbi:NUDIX hydrolase [Candidatus Vecturithrix granuli]|uniref:NUDIX hydrolase n=1 Tax=Vecturithrix granuli TaxID=1499967 RepID=A0A081C8P5_VECG1|nr:NUDIX hydrolase [Candidatus Vecturithrix granuli]